jgi:hypothetical protein
MIVWPANAMPVRPDAYAECLAKIMRVVARASSELAGMKRVGGVDDLTATYAGEHSTDQKER